MMALSSTLTIDLPDEAATAALAEDVAARILPGDVVTLSGGLGAGKTTFARALIRAVADDPRLEVPSPTFTLVQSYASPRLPITHFDLYRLSVAEEIDEIGLDEALASGAALIEWPDRAGSRLPKDRLDIAFQIAGEGRHATISGSEEWMARLARSRAVRAFLDRSGWATAKRRHLQGDASTRAYERIRKAGQTSILMDWPSAGAAPVLDRRVVFRAADVRAFIAVDDALRGLGLSAPEIYAADIANGLLLLEDLGHEGVLENGAPAPDRYRLVVDVLAMLHGSRRPAELPLPGGETHRLPRYTAEAFTVEVDMFLDWYFPQATGAAPPQEVGDDFRSIWRDAIARLERTESGWVLLDVHSPNLLWLAEREGLARIGLLDFQDMMIGPTAYDVASLCQDARVTVTAELEAELLGRYIARRRAADRRFDADAFTEAYAILAAQRATKILGVFARLADHARKRNYLQHIPRLREYLQRSLAHPALNRYALWYREHLLPAA
jgi:N-acetylmuramate 1-kinase